jgi:hypothetical protein
MDMNPPIKLRMDYTGDPISGFIPDNRLAGFLSDSNRSEER